jgi:hypothetical protein
MATKKLIAVKTFCQYHNISHDFILDLHRNELIELVMIKRTRYIPETQLHELERILRIYNEFNVNIEGLQIVLHLLSSLQKKEAALTALKNHLAFYNARHGL